MNRKLTKLLSVFIIAGTIGAGAAVGMAGCNNGHEHEAKNEWSRNETQHWHDCTANDGEKLDLANHEDTNNDGKCDVCDYVISTGGEEETPPATQEYTITFNANGHGTAPDSVTTVDGKATKPADLTDDDYIFGGWYLTADCTGEAIDFTTHVFETNTTVYAKWTAKQVTPPATQKYTVTWKNYDGTVLKTDTEVAEGTIPTYDGVTPTKEGNAQYSYTFKGWDKDVVAVTDDVEYVAEFEQSVNKYTVTWKNYDGTVLETDPEVPYGTIPTYDGATPEREDADGKSYNFIGWDKEVAAVTGNVTYTATYEELAEGQYAIVYNLQGHGSAIANGKTEDGKLSGAAAVPEATGYKFGGWYLTAECEGEAIDFATHEFTAKTTVYAKWTVVTYTITYVGADGVTNENATAYTVESEDITLNDLTKANYDFLGWYNGEDKVTKIVKGSTGDLTLTARWQATEYTITYVGVEGATHSNPTAYTVESATIELADATKDGYRFNGWTIVFEGEPVEISSIPAGTTLGNLTITATWVQQITLTFEDKDGNTIGTKAIDKDGTLPSDLETLVAKAGYVVYKTYTDFTAGTECASDTTFAADTTVVVTYRLSDEAIQSAMLETSKMQRVTVTSTAITSAGGQSLVTFESDGTIVFDGISGSSETYRVYKQDNSYTEYFHANGGNDWYKRDVVATEGETYATYVEGVIRNNIISHAVMIVTKGMSFDDKTDCYYNVQSANAEQGNSVQKMGMFIKDGLVAGYEVVVTQNEQTVMHNTLTIEERTTAESVQLPEANDYTRFIQLANSKNLIIYEDFSEGAEYGNLTSEKQYLALYADKSSEAEHFSVNENGQLTQTTNGANFGMTIPFGVPKGIVEGCFDISVYNSVGSSWKLIQFGKELIIGTKESKTEFEYSTDGGTTYNRTGIAFNKDTAYTVHFTYNVETGEVVVNINGSQVVSATLTKEVASVYVQSGNYGARKLTLDNIAVVAQQKTAAEYYETAIANFQKEFESKYILETVYELDENGEIKNDAEGNPIVLKAATHSIQKDYITQFHSNQLKDLLVWKDDERSAVEMLKSIDGSLAIYDQIFETDKVVIAARDAAIKQVEDLATSYTITLEAYANKQSYETCLNNLKEAVNDTTGCYRTMDIQSNLERILSNISQISTDEQIIASLKSTVTTEITEYKAIEIEALQNAVAKANIATAKSEAITALESVSGETSDEIITAINAHVEKVKADLDKAIDSADDTADKHKAEYKTTLSAYGEELSSSNEVLALITEGQGEIDKVADSAPASDAEAVLNTYKLKIYRQYSIELYNAYVTAENAKVHANDSSIDLETGAPEVPTFADCGGENAINEALESAKTAYTEFVDGVLAATEYTITFGEGETATSKTVKYGELVTADGIADPTAGDYTHILKGWLKEGASYNFSTPVYGSFTLTPNIVDAIKKEAITNTFSWAAIANTTADQAAPEMTGVNAFITPGDGLQYRTSDKTDKDKNYIQGKAGETAFSVTYESAGTLVLNVRGSGDSKATSISIKNSENEVVGSWRTTGTKVYVDVTINIPKAGTYTVVVGSEGVCRFASIVQTQEAYKVEKIHVSSVEISGESRVELGKSTTLTATITPDNASIKDVVWSIAEGSEYATIDQDGNLTATAVGTVKVVATVDGSASEEFVVEVYKNAVTGVTIARQDGVAIVDNAITLTTGTVQLVGVVNADATVKGVTWSIPEGTTCITLSENGLVTYVGVGTVVVTVTAVDDSTKTATVTITCSEVAVASVAFGENQPATVNINETITLSASALAADGGTPTETGLTWESSDTSKATVENGIVTGVAEGSVTITVKSVNYVDDETTPNLKATMTVTINRVSVISVTVSGANTVVAESTITLTATINPTNATNKTVTWAVTNGTGSATINASTGVLTGVTAGTVTVTATADGVTSAEYTVTVTAKPAYETVILSCGESELTSSNATFTKTDTTMGVTVSSGSVKYRNRSITKEIEGRTCYGWQSQNKTGDILTIKTGSVKVKITVYFSGMSDNGDGKSAEIKFTVGENSETVSTTGDVVSYTSAAIDENSTLTLNSNSSNKPAIWAIKIEPVS